MYSCTGPIVLPGHSKNKYPGVPHPCLAYLGEMPEAGFDHVQNFPAAITTTDCRKQPPIQAV